MSRLRIARTVGTPRYFPVVRCPAARMCPGRPRAPRSPPRSVPRIGDGVLRMRRRNARSSGRASVRSVNAFGETVRNTGPRTGSTTATTALELLGMANTIPSSSGPPSATRTRSPGCVESIDLAYRVWLVSRASQEADRGGSGLSDRGGDQGRPSRLHRRAAGCDRRSTRSRDRRWRAGSAGLKCGVPVADQAGMAERRTGELQREGVRVRAAAGIF